MSSKAGEVCRTCFWWKHNKAPKKVCASSGPAYSCDKWADKKEHRMCANCSKFNNSDECPEDSKDPHQVCKSWEKTTDEDFEDEENLPSKGQVKALIKAGKDPMEIGKELGIPLNRAVENVKNLTADSPQVAILKGSLNSVMTIMPFTEMACKDDPKMSNVYAFTALIGTMRELLNDLNNRRDPGDQYTELLKTIIEPLTTEFLQTLTINIQSSRTKILECVDVEKHSLVKTQIDLMFKQIAGEMQKTLNKHLEKLREMLGMDSSDLERPDVFNKMQ